MPLLKPIDPPDDHQEETHLTAGLYGFAERTLAYVGWHLEPAAAPKQDPLAGVPRVGEYYVDYSGLTPEEADAIDPEIEALLKRSKPVSR